MGFQFGKRGYTFGVIAIILWALNILLSFQNNTNPISLVLSGIILICGVAAFFMGKKELAADLMPGSPGFFIHKEAPAQKRKPLREMKSFLVSDLIIAAFCPEHQLNAC